MQDIGVGLIGYGLGGRAFHAPYVRVTEGMTLRAVVSRDPPKVHADIRNVEVVPSVDALLALPGIELVIVSSPDEFHAEHAIAALNAGKHVVIDKPFATSLNDARRIAEAGRTQGRLLSVFQNRRWDSDFRTLRELIDDGALGEIVQFESHFDRFRPEPAPTWREVREGGSWLDLGPHLIDQALLLFGKPEGIQADIATLREGSAAPDYFHVTLRYPRLRVLLHSSKLVADDGLRFAVHGTRGSWIKHGTDVQESATVAGQLPGGPDWGVDPQAGLLTIGTESEQRPNIPGDYRQFYAAVAKAIRGEGPNPVTPAEALAVMEVLEAGLESSEQRKEVSL